MGEEVRSKSSAGSEETLELPRGRLTITHPVAAVMLFTYRGHVTADVVPFVEASVNRVLETGVRPDLFVDLDRIEGYDSEYRRAISQWGARFYRRFGEVRFLVRSRIVAMGVAVSNLTAGGVLKATTRRVEFEAALQAAIRRHSP